MSVFLGHIPCPQCGSKDNLADYDDHQWCFGCKYFVNKDDIGNLRKRFHQRSQVSNDNPNSIKLHTTLDIPTKALKWLLSYGITMQEIAEHNISWEESQELLVLINNDDYYQARTFGQHRVKYISKGKKPLTILGDADTIVCVEDFLSAIKIARLTPEYCSIPLLGSHLSEEVVEALRKRWKNVVIWLDRDKAKEAIQIARNLKQRGFNSRVCITEKDPKEYSKGELSEWLKSN